MNISSTTYPKRLLFLLIFLFGGSPFLLNAQDCEDILYEPLREVGEVIEDGIRYKKVQIFVENPNAGATNSFFALVDRQDPEFEDFPDNAHKYNQWTNEIFIPLDAVELWLVDVNNPDCKKPIPLHLEEDPCDFRLNERYDLDSNDCSNVNITLIPPDTITLESVEWFFNGDTSSPVHTELQYRNPPAGNYIVELKADNGCEVTKEYRGVACPRSNAGEDFTIPYCIEDSAALNLRSNLGPNVDSGRFYTDNFSEITEQDASQMTFSQEGETNYYYISQTNHLGRDTAIITVDAYSGNCNNSCLFNLAVSPECDSVQEITFSLLDWGNTTDTMANVILPDGNAIQLRVGEFYTFENTRFNDSLFIDVSSTSNMGCDSTILLGYFSPCIETNCDYTVVAAVDSNLCYRDTSGRIDLTIANSIDPVSVSWSSGTTGPSLQQLRTGIYEAYIEDGTGCRDTMVYEVGGPVRGIEIDVSTEENGNDSVTLIVSAVNGTGPYQFEVELDHQYVTFSQGSVTERRISFEQTIDTARVTVTDARGCIAVQTILLTPRCFTLEIDTLATNCGMANGSIALTVPEEVRNGGSITWEDTDENSLWERSNLPSGEYPFEISYGECLVPDTAIIRRNNYSQPAFVQSNECPVDGLFEVEVRNSENLVNWTIGGSTSSDFTTQLLANREHEIIIETIEGCVDTVLVNDTEASWIEELTYRSPDLLHASITLDESSLNSFGWQQDSSELCTYCFEYQSEDVIQTGNYTFFVAPFDGCYADTTISLQQDEMFFEMPNVITLNNSVNNQIQIFDPFDQMASVMRFSVYDRYGNELYVNENMSHGTNDSLNWPQADTALPNVIICVAQIKCKDDKEVTLTQSVLVLR
ncbi:hypothetical protein [Membranihabitans maritimus]|uniref:hypothetical protein n=1 Tax=Membranihabitans maritimus TaxID=2904244 RepID=UPI001F3319B8|nr:hypothetical protein [Membranihabitans maritimus]